MSVAIEDYALIGDCETVALVSRGGSIDWLCWPRFDSPACFAALLGNPSHGRWLIESTDPDARISRRYRDNTLILETLIRTSVGSVTVIDFMPLRGANSDVVRMVRGDAGCVAMRTELILRFDYGRTVPWVNRQPDGSLRAIAGSNMVTLHTEIPLRGVDLTTKGEFDIKEGDIVWFVLTYALSYKAAPNAIDPMKALEETEIFWSNWTAKEEHPAGWKDAVTRSLITLKALTYSPTGGIVAAPTTSLPEKLGGVRNWDYRFCWLRDATLTLLALMNSGYYAEAKAWRDWLLRAAAGAPSQMQIMYGIAGDRLLSEHSIPWLPGYDGSQPVRVGNAAHTQRQLDVFGEVMDALYQADRGRLETGEEHWQFQLSVMRHLLSVWEQEDMGIWETRGKPKHFTYSKVMAWLALDRAIKSAREFKLNGPVDQWIAVRENIHRQVCRNGFDRELGSFVQAYGSKELDASLLLLPTVGFLPPTDERILGTIAAIEKRLFVDGFLLRYDTETSPDGLPCGEGAFIACTFWLADAYVLAGKVDSARELFERLLDLRNDVGLLSEQYDSAAKRLIGNFPQAFSHVALINTAENLGRAHRPAEQRSA